MKKRLHYWLPLILVILLTVVQPTKTYAATVDSGTYGENITWALDSSGTMTISGTGDMDELNEEEWDHWWNVRKSIKTVVIKDGVTSIGSNAFCNCINLISIDIPDSITHIDYWAFYGCTNLSSIIIPKNVASIGSKAFYGCSSLNGFWVDEANPIYSSDQYGVLFNKDKTKLLKAPQTLAGNYIVPDGVTVLGSYYELFDHPYDTAFSGCSKLTSITLPDSITVIDEATFAGCSSLTKVNIPNGVKEIRYVTFQSCTSLTSITIPDSVTRICNAVFGGCSNLTQITLGEGIQEIWDNAFYRCNNLWHVLFTGTEDEWNTMISNSKDYGNYAGNESLLSAARHYNCTGNEILDLKNKKCSICLANCNHVPGADATATTPQTCTICGKELKPATGITPPPATAPSATVAPTTGPSATVPPTTVSPTTVLPTTAPSATVPESFPTASETLTPTVTPPQTEENEKSEEGGFPVVASVVIVVLAGSGTTAGIILWKKKH